MGEYGMHGRAIDPELLPRVIHVREEAPRLLWRSIVQGFGWSIGFFLAGVLFWLILAVLLGLLFHQAPPSVPSF